MLKITCELASDLDLSRFKISKTVRKCIESLEKRETRNEKRETRNEKRETRNEKRETRNEKRG
ncbi:hypothetical protein F0256_17445 [Vibrio europaeus]|nr:hypothetical protein [Vibrio europaeus]